MALKSLVSNDADKLAAVAPPVVVVFPLVDFLEEPHAANSPAVVTTATDQTHARFNETFIIPSRVGPI